MVEKSFLDRSIHPMHGFSPTRSLEEGSGLLRAAAELIGKELIAPLKLRATMNADMVPRADNPGKDDNPGNPGNPGEPKSRAKVIGEDELERYLEAGWDIATPLANGRIAVRKPDAAPCQRIMPILRSEIWSPFCPKLGLGVPGQEVVWVIVPTHGPSVLRP